MSLLAHIICHCRSVATDALLCLVCSGLHAPKHQGLLVARHFRMTISCLIRRHKKCTLDHKPLYALRIVFAALILPMIVTSWQSIRLFTQWKRSCKLFRGSSPIPSELLNWCQTPCLRRRNQLPPPLLLGEEKERGKWSGIYFSDHFG